MFTRFLLVMGILVYGIGLYLLATGSKPAELVPTALFTSACFGIYIVWGDYNG